MTENTVDVETIADVVTEPTPVPVEPEQPQEKQRDPYWVKRAEDAKAQVQTLLDRFKAHNLPLDYPAIIDQALRLLVTDLIQSGRVSEEEISGRFASAQLALIRPEFDNACIRRDEVQLRVGGAAASVGMAGRGSKPWIERAAQSWRPNLRGLPVKAPEISSTAKDIKDTGEGEDAQA